jgi:sec-independent protein translocase protein TatA
VFDFSPVQIIIVLVIALVVFGPKRLPEMGKNLGRSLREFKSSVSGEDERPAARTENLGPADWDPKGAHVPSADFDADREPAAAGVEAVRESNEDIAPSEERVAGGVEEVRSSN